MLHDAFVELYKQLCFLTFLENYTRVFPGLRPLGLALLSKSCTGFLPSPPNYGEPIWQSYLEAQDLENKDGLSQDAVGLPGQASFGVTGEVLIVSSSPTLPSTPLFPFPLQAHPEHWGNQD